MTKADDRLIRVGDAYEYWRKKAQSVTDLKNAKTLRNMLDEVPTAQKAGKWINCKYPLGECSECHAIVDIQNNEANYCPVCGSKNGR